jgi:hypothetical protein
MSDSNRPLCNLADALKATGCMDGERHRPGILELIEERRA